jgi:pimeloyl-ACP methyl ester carboxylesterase
MKTPMKTLKTMLKLSLIAIAAPLSVARAAPPPTATPAAPTSPAKTSGRVNLKGVDYHYEVRGQGDPLLLLHGGLGNGDMFEPLLPILGPGRQLITVDLQGHGRSSLGSRPIRCEAIADDVAALLKRLGRAKVDVLGYSFGGCVALRLAVQHPDVVRRLALVSTPFSADGWYPEMRPLQAQVSAALFPMMKETPMYKSYVAVAPRPDQFPRLLDAMGESMRQSYDWSVDVAKLKMPVMLVFGDADMVRPEHQIKFYQLLGGGLKDAGWNRESMPRNRLAILPDLTHYDIFASPRLAETVRPFLDGQSGARSWAEVVKAQAQNK